MTAEDMKNAFPPRDPADAQNWYGTSLFGFNGCDDKDKTWREKIIEAYSDASELVNHEDITEDLDFNSAAALQFLGPSGLNKDQQAQIQNVITNLATVKEGASWFTPNWIRVRCDDPLKLCIEEPDDPDNPKCPPASAQGEDQSVETIAYARNPFEKDNDKYSDITFCPAFFRLRNLGNAMAYGSGHTHPILKADLRNYESRADNFLHELLHLDLAANSKDGSPNPDIRDLLIKFTFGTGPDKGKKSIWTKVYGSRLAKILASFQPWRKDQPLGYFIQRSDDSYTMFILAMYVQRKLGYYPYIPMVYDQLNDMPLVPPRDRNDQPGLSGLVPFEKSDAEPAVFLDFTQDGDGICPSLYEGGSGEDVEIGAPHDRSLYPDLYWEQYKGWIKEIETFLGQEENTTAA
ncbi:hypothetical protein NCS57_01286900 [Fusarium keratoplasticum]|uniref:Uncharacterized protein n=1 Tax=Fusarium keratoplasticum TaxID=1328300 RepID=A0ACC0QGD6_9HYPO|nr:hypothetical protein NCS57_01286900 [Fusarium keratoplasticum]KAI8652238.1 hypothetical protein NCS57_01286900 [Fusarium keratoplasticum]